MTTMKKSGKFRDRRYRNDSQFKKDRKTEIDTNSARNVSLLISLEVLLNVTQNTK